MLPILPGFVLAITVAATPVKHPPPEHKVMISSHHITGISSWYAYRSHQAAAGPALRRFLGAHWRGSRVIVCARTCISVTITDWMRADKLIDLNRSDFARLASPSRGLVRVTIRKE